MNRSKQADLEDEEEEEFKGMLEVIRHCLEEAQLYITQGESQVYIGKHIDKMKKADEATAKHYSVKVLMEKVLPHVGTD